MGSIASNEIMKKVENLVHDSISPKWIESFLEKKYFDDCPNHNDLPQCELNRYCITCDASICNYCVMDGCHDSHNSLTINKYSYQHVVPLAEMEIYIDCDRIQPYKCNKKAVVSLNSEAGIGINCRVCKRKVVEGDGRFVFCSIACKIQAITEQLLRPHDDDNHIGTTEKKEDKEDRQPPVNESYRKRSRKGIPRRAPLF